MSKGLHSKVKKICKGEFPNHIDFNTFRKLFIVSSEMLDLLTEVGYVPTAWYVHTVAEMIDEEEHKAVIEGTEDLWGYCKKYNGKDSGFWKQRDFLKKQKAHFRSEYFAYLIAWWMHRKWKINDDDLLLVGNPELEEYAKKHLVGLYWIEEYNKRIEEKK